MERGLTPPSPKTVFTCKVLFATTQPQEAVMNKINSNKGKKYSHLSLAEREEIAIGLENGLKQYEIALILKRSASAISREIKRNSNCRCFVKYRASRAQLRTEKRKIESHKRIRIPIKGLRRYIAKYIRKRSSPEIVAFMAMSKNNQWKTNYETIYQWIYVERKDLIPFLVRGHKKRRNRGSVKQKRCPVPNRVMIEHRPNHINHRSYFGHWEADTITSRKSNAAAMVLVERKARQTIIRKLNRKNARSMHKAVVGCLRTISPIKRQSITYDNGPENALHELTNNKLGTKSYFCNPYRSWERGTVENIIGIIRRFFPKGTNWKDVTQWDLNIVARFINNRPMKCLGYKTPNQVFIALAH
jgi:IS30 family transposase